MTTVPCDECGGTGFVSFKTWPGGIEVDNDDQPCPNIRCIAGQIELTDAEVRAIEAGQCNERT